MVQCEAWGTALNWRRPTQSIACASTSSAPSTDPETARRPHCLNLLHSTTNQSPIHHDDGQISRHFLRSSSFYTHLRDLFISTMFRNNYDNDSVTLYGCSSQIASTLSTDLSLQFTSRPNIPGRICTRGGQARLGRCWCRQQEACCPHSCQGWARCLPCTFPSHAH